MRIYSVNIHKIILHIYAFKRNIFIILRASAKKAFSFRRFFVSFIYCFLLKYVIKYYGINNLNRGVRLMVLLLRLSATPSKVECYSFRHGSAVPPPPRRRLQIEEVGGFK